MNGSFSHWPIDIERAAAEICTKLSVGVVGEMSEFVCSLETSRRDLKGCQGKVVASSIVQGPAHGGFSFIILSAV